MHVIFVPYSLMKVDPASWMKMVTRFKGKKIKISSCSKRTNLMGNTKFFVISCSWKSLCTWNNDKLERQHLLNRGTRLIFGEVTFLICYATSGEA